MHAVRLSALAAVAAALFTSSAAAQRQRGLVDVSPTSDRRGLWMDIGAGWGIESYKFGNESYVDGLGKPTFNFKIGGTVNPNVRLGGEVNVWWNGYQDESGYDVDETLTNVMAIGRFYPSKTMGLFLKGGVGLGITTASLEYSNSTTETGFATVLGAGYEIKVGKQLFITPGFDWYQSSFQKRGDTTLHERLLNYSLVLTWQPGH
jgi:hypothetical protein